MYLQGKVRALILSKNWNRQIQVAFDTRTVSLTDFYIEFTSIFDVIEEPNETSIYIKNLSQSTINSYIKKDNRFVLNAGDENDTGTISTGYIIDTDTGWNGTDKDTSIIGLDTTDYYLNYYISKTYKAGVLASQIIDDLLKVIGITVGEIQLVQDIQYVSGRVCNGKVRDILRSIVINDCKTNLQIIQGAIFIRPISNGLGTGFILSAETGLIGSPEKMDNVENQPEDIRPTHKCSCLLRYNIRPMVRIRVRSKTLNADAIVIRGKHEGSKRGKFETYMELKVI